MSDVWFLAEHLAGEVMRRLEDRERLKDVKLKDRLALSPHPLPEGVRPYWQGFDWTKAVRPLLPSTFQMGEFEATIPEICRPRFSWSDGEGRKHTTFLHFVSTNDEWRLQQVVHQSPDGTHEILDDGVYGESARRIFARSRIRGIAACIEKALFEEVSVRKPAGT